MTLGALLKQKGDSVISVGPDASLLEIARVITSRRIGAVLVVNAEGGMVGIVSERDVVKALANHPETVLSLSAKDVMTADVVTGSATTTVDHAMEVMDAGYFRHLPVVEDGRLAGIISIRDVVKFRLMLHEHDVDSLKAYIARQA